nr:endo alpha-1,4 polygalactosaminidase [Thermus arciformis]
MGAWTLVLLAACSAAALPGTSPPPSFTLALNPASLSVQQGGQGQTTLTLTPQGGFTGTVDLSLVGAPEGVSLSPTSLQVTGTEPVSQALTLTVASAVPPGTYALEVRGTSGSLTREADLTLTVSAPPPPPAPSFNLSLNPSLSLQQGGQAQVTLTVTPENGFTGTVDLSLVGAPSGVSLSPTSVGVPGPGPVNRTLTLTVASSVNPGTYALRVRGTSGSLVREVDLTLTVNAPPPSPSFALALDPTSLSVQQGDQGQVTLTLTPQNGFTGTVALSLVNGQDQVPQGLSLSSTSVQVTGSSPVNQALTLTASSTTPTGTYRIKVRGTAGSLTKEADLTLTVNASAPVRTWVYQLTGYPSSGLAALGKTGADLFVVDLTKDGQTPWRLEDLAPLGGRPVLAYLEVGGLEDYRVEYPLVRQQAPDLLLNPVPGWPGERYVRYWDERWWTLVLKPRLDKALAAGFRGVYLDLVDAYEGIDLSLVPGETRERLAGRMVDLLRRVRAYTQGVRPGFWVFPQNAPELRTRPGYLEAVDGIGLEELFFYATDKPCTDPGCRERLEHARAIRDAGKLVLTVDYATLPQNVQAACQKARAEGFVPYVTTVGLDRISPPCP